MRLVGNVQIVLLAGLICVSGVAAIRNRSFPDISGPGRPTDPPLPVFSCKTQNNTEDFCDLNAEKKMCGYNWDGKRGPKVPVGCVNYDDCRGICETTGEDEEFWECIIKDATWKGKGELCCCEPWHKHATPHCNTLDMPCKPKNWRDKNDRLITSSAPTVASSFGTIILLVSAKTLVPF